MKFTDTISLVVLASAVVAAGAKQKMTSPSPPQAKSTRRPARQAHFAVPTDINGEISQALADPSVGLVADNHFSSLLMSAIESSNGNIPVINL
ncbi:hypothetical protein GGI26_005510 [Coemansia sp. RSA 1358]|nr:hypothetical protein EDC05_005244 [Coemansia umbellata]KAJ2619836.1 hypothetical protein GGI26_005510 [Coemansia sp. RSA 1358]